MINARIAEIDQLLSEQLNEILHHAGLPEAGGLLARAALPGARERDEHDAQDPRAQRLEEGPAQGPRARGRVRPERALQEGLRGGVRHLRRRPLRRPWSGDYEFSPTSRRTSALLEKISNVAAARARPVHRRGRARALQLEHFTELAAPRDLAKIFESVDYAKWRSFRDSEDSRYVGLCLPHILMRLPYGPDTNPVEAFNFEEDVDGTDHSKYLWGNAAYAFGHPAHRARSPSTAGARRSAAWRAAAWSRACRSTPSRPTRATSR